MTTTLGFLSGLALGYWAMRRSWRKTIDEAIQMSRESEALYKEASERNRAAVESYEQALAFGDELRKSLMCLN